MFDELWIQLTGENTKFTRPQRTCMQISLFSILDPADQRLLEKSEIDPDDLKRILFILNILGFEGYCKKLAGKFENVIQNIIKNAIETYSSIDDPESYIAQETQLHISWFEHFSKALDPDMKKICMKRLKELKDDSERQTLQEIFIWVCGITTSKESAILALCICDRIVKQRMTKSKKSLEQYFGKRNYTEILDFWDVYKDYDSALTEAKTELNITITNIIYSVNLLYHENEYNKLISQMDSQLLAGYRSLCEKVANMLYLETVVVYRPDRKVLRPIINIPLAHKKEDTLLLIYIEIARVLVSNPDDIIVMHCYLYDHYRPAGYYLNNGAWTPFNTLDTVFAKRVLPHKTLPPYQVQGSIT